LSQPLAYRREFLAKKEVTGRAEALKTEMIRLHKVAA
jgi:hypothetical protein